MKSGENVGKEHLYTVGGNVNLWISILWKSVWRFLKRLKIETTL
jgi:hypothetical protein